MRMKAVLSAVVLASLCAGAPATAQMMTDPTQWYVNNQIYSMRVFNSVVGNAMTAKATKAAKAKDSARSAAPATAASATLFTETPGVSLASTLAARGGDQNPPEARQLFEFFVELYKQTAAKDGFPPNDLAYAFEYFVVNNYHIHHDLMAVPYEKDPRATRGRDGFDRIAIMAEKKNLQVTISQERAIYNQFRESLGRNPEIRKMTDAQKQESAELLAILFGVNYAAYMNGINAGDDAATERGRQMARQGLDKLLGVPASRIRITQTGLQL